MLFYIKVDKKGLLRRWHLSIDCNEMSEQTHGRSGEKLVQNQGENDFAVREQQRYGG